MNNLLDKEQLAEKPDSENTRQVNIMIDEERALGDLLRISLESSKLEDYLQQALETLIISVHWLNLKPKGGIFLNQKQGKGKVLELVAKHNLSPELHSLCQQIPFGHCLCGAAAEMKSIQHANCVDERHHVQFEGMLPHGHYNAPILENKQVLGVLVLYLPHGHKRDENEVRFLQRVTDVLSMGIQRRYASQRLLREKEQSDHAIQQLTNLTRNLPGIIFQREISVEGSDSYPFVGAAAESLLGYSAEQLLAGGIYSLNAIYGDDYEKYQNAWNLSKQELSPLDVEYRIVLNSGMTRWVHCMAKPHLDEDNSIIWDGLLLDINDRKDLEGQLVQAQKLESVGQMAAGIAHEINTPTQYVSDNTHFLKESFEDLMKLISMFQKLISEINKGEAAAELVSDIENMIEEIDIEFIQDEIPQAFEQAMEGLQKIMVIVSAMKSFSHPGSEDAEPVDINSLIENTITVSRNEWKYVANLKTELDPDLPMIIGFRDKLSQVFLNLIVNAAHAIDEKSEKNPEENEIKIISKLKGDLVEIRISDTGPGVPESIRSRIFDPFFTTKAVGKGSGQGLSIAHSVVVEIHSGKMIYEEGDHGGAIFIVQLPINSFEQ